MSTRYGRALVRGYATFARKAMAYPVRKNQLPDAPRIYTPTKTHLHAQYLQMMGDNELVLLLSPTNFSAAHLMKLRRELAATAITPKNAVDKTPRSTPSLTMVRVQLLSAAMRMHPTLKLTRNGMAKLVDGPLAVLTLPELHTQQLGQILRILDRTGKAPAKGAASAKPREEELDSPPPGGGGTRLPKAVAIPRLHLLGGVVEGRLFQVEGVRDVSQLPSLDILRAQIVGLISSPAAQLAGLLGQAGGGRLLRTLEGLKQGLEEGSETPTGSEASEEAKQ